MSESEGAPSGSIESLKRVKAMENEAEARLTKLRSEGEALLKRTRAELEAALETARSESQQGRESTLSNARAKAAEEVEALLAEGRKVVEKIEGTSAKPPAAKRDRILDIVVGEFRSGSD